MDTTSPLQVIQQKLAAAQASPSPLKAGDLTPAYEKIQQLQTGRPVKFDHSGLLASNPT